MRSLYGANSLDDWEVSSFKHLYLRLLRPYGAYLGAWAGALNPLGSCLLVYLHPPAIIGAVVSCLRFREPGKAASYEVRKWPFFRVPRVGPPLSQTCISRLPCVIGSCVCRDRAAIAPPIVQDVAWALCSLS